MEMAWVEWSTSPESQWISGWAKRVKEQPHTAKPAAAGSTPGARKGTATHLTEKRWAGRSPPPPKGSPRCTVLSLASFFGSLRSRADNYMSKWHSPSRARGGDPSARRAWGREEDWHVARAVHRFRARATQSAIAGPGPGTGGGGECTRVCACMRV